MSKKISFAISAGFALLAAIVVYMLLRMMIPSVPVVVATKDMPVGYVINGTDVTVRKMPPIAVSGAIYTDTAQVVGKTVSGAPIMSKDVIRRDHLMADGSMMAALQSYAPEGWAAVELPQGTAIGMQGLKRGNKVDIYALMAGPSGGKQSTLLVKGAIILSTPWTTVGKQDTSQQLYVVAVPPEMASAVAGATVRGDRMTLVLPDEEGGQ